MDLALIGINAYLFTAVMLTAFCAMYSFVKRRSTIHILFAFLCLCIMFYSFGYLMEINVTSMKQMLFWNQVQYFGIPFFPSLWVLFILNFTNHKLKNVKWIQIVIFIIPVITFILRATNSYHYLFYKNIGIAEFASFSVLALQKGPWYFVQSIFVTTSIITAAFILSKYSRKATRMEKISYYLIISITFFPYIGVIINLFNIGQSYLDYTAFSVPIISLMLFSTTFNNEILQLKSFARDKIFENSQDGILLLNKKYEILDYNSAAKAIFPVLTMDCLEKPLANLIDEKNSLNKAIQTKAKCQIDITQGEHPMHFYATTADIMTGRGKLAGYSVTFSDITPIVQANIKNSQLAMELDEEKNLLKTTLLSVGDGVISTDLNANVVLMNQIAEWLTGWTQKEAAGRSIDEIMRLSNENKNNSEINPVYKVLEFGCAFEMDENTFLLSRSSKMTPIEDSAAPIRNDDGTITGAVIVFRDFTEKKKRNEMVQYLSYHDQLTGVYNRRYFDERMIEFNKEEYMPVGLIMMDVNGLKLANDAFGHKTGDQLLHVATQIIQKTCRHDDVFSRVGGDEFVILLPHTSESTVEAIVKSIQDELSGQKVGEIEVSVSFGWDTKKRRINQLSDVYKKAEDLMYQHKLNESPAMREKTIHRIIESLHEKNPYEREHGRNVGGLCKKMGRALNFSPTQINDLHIAGILHDIGKIAIDSSIINHPGILSEKDWIETKRHTELGYRILGAVNDMVPIAEIVLAHHENWDGTGYPKGLAGGQIPITARIIRIADSYDAMVNDRIYRKSIGNEAAKQELRKNSGTLFDPDLVTLFIGLI